MNYIILDMEWDGSYFSKEKRFINQILQIGAVKLNERFEVVDTFEKNNSLIIFTSRFGPLQHPYGHY